MMFPSKYPTLNKVLAIRLKELAIQNKDWLMQVGEAISGRSREKKVYRKPFKLTDTKSHKYSSWTHNPQVIEGFVSEMAVNYNLEMYTIVVFRKDFSKIFLDVSALANYFGVDVLEGSQDEVIIKTKDLHLEPSDIYKYYKSNTYKLVPFKREE